MMPRISGRQACGSGYVDRSGGSDFSHAQPVEADVDEPRAETGLAVEEVVGPQALERGVEAEWLDLRPGGEEPATPLCQGSRVVLAEAAGSGSSRRSALHGHGGASLGHQFVGACEQLLGVPRLKSGLGLLLCACSVRALSPVLGLRRERCLLGGLASRSLAVGGRLTSVRMPEKHMGFLGLGRSAKRERSRPGIQLNMALRRSLVRL